MPGALPFHLEGGETVQTDCKQPGEQNIDRRENRQEQATGLPEPTWSLWRHHLNLPGPNKEADLNSDHGMKTMRRSKLLLENTSISLVPDVPSYVRRRRRSMDVVMHAFASGRGNPPRFDGDGR